tara:strand:- start:382 stop:1581 length:1200 start_codon:yes stop_codon:yes gene_type:complete
MSSLTVGTISEKVTDAGVAVDGVTLKDGGVGTTSSAVALHASSLNGGQFGGRRNMIINGAMQIAQRGTSFTSVTASAYHLDRFQYNLTGTVGASTVTQNTVTDLAGFTKSLKVDVTTADSSLASGDRLTICYKIEGQDLQGIGKGTSSAKELTLSFYIKATKTGTQIVELFDQDNTRHCAKAVTINSSNTWEQKTITFPADTTGAFGNDNGNSLSIFFGLACGTDFTSGTLATAWASNTNANRFVGQVNHFDSTSNNFEITGVQLEIGSTATPFEHRSFGEELALCQRYLYRINGKDSGGTTIGMGFSNIATNSYSHIAFPVNMRTAPSVSGSGFTASDFNSYTVTGTSLTITAFESSSLGCSKANLIVVTAGGLTTLRPSGNALTASASSFIAFDAEL